MARYTDADAVLKKVEQYFAGLPIVVHHDMVELIENAPTADVRENVHAHWIKHEDRECWYCSHCKEDNAYAYYYIEYNLDEPELQDFFCPKCGAVMDEGRQP